MKLNELHKNAKDAFEAFSQEELQRSKQEIFDDSLRIHFYQAMWDFFNSGSVGVLLIEHEISALADLGKSLISCLYDEYLSDENSMVETWPGITSLIRTFLGKDD